MVLDEINYFKKLNNEKEVDKVSVLTKKAKATGLTLKK